jgi:hypothetical protein
MGSIHKRLARKPPPKDTPQTGLVRAPVRRSVLVKPYDPHRTPEIPHMHLIAHVPQPDDTKLRERP